ncbi:membrane hypothetical protein [Sphingobacterium sp. PM2-P1-29]|nr:membrane hypothetical protein [Sphingobacterium sp. PM2-P1-29]
MFNRRVVTVLSLSSDQAIAANASQNAAANEIIGQNRSASSRVFNINTRRATICTASYIMLTTILAMIMFYCSHKIVASKIIPTEVEWIKMDSVNLKPGPTWFFYDNKSGKLNALHQIDENEKTLLIALLESGDTNFKSYSQAISRLAFQSNQIGQTNFSNWLILLYAIAGLIGVQMRTINNFVGVACFKNDFNFYVWWPWYLVRPILGFITGAVVFLLIDGKHLLGGPIATGYSTATLAIAFLGGFSTDEFYELLRKLSKKLFGKS